MSTLTRNYDPIKYKTPTGSKLNCKGWIQEAALGMLLNNLNPEVAERPDDLIVYGGRGKAARNFEALDNIIAALKILENDASLLIQSGKPVGILKTHKDAPRVLISNSQLVPAFSIPDKERILRKLNHAVIFEKFLGTKYIGEKRFSLEGGETTVPALDSIIEKSAELGVEEVVIGMAHRGRLNILANIMGKTYEQIFNEFEGKATPDTTMGDGDVKYHLGFSHQHPARNGKTLT